MENFSFNQISNFSGAVTTISDTDIYKKFCDTMDTRVAIFFIILFILLITKIVVWKYFLGLNTYKIYSFLCDMIDIITFGLSLYVIIFWIVHFV